MTKEDRLEVIKTELKKSKKILNALCDENRQNILLVLLENCSTGVNVNIKMHKKGKISVYKKGNKICPNCVYSLQTPLWFKTSLVR